MYNLQALRQLPSSNVFGLCPACRPADAAEEGAVEGSVVGGEGDEGGEGGEGGGGKAVGAGVAEEYGYEGGEGGGGEGGSSVAGWAALLLLLLTGGVGYAAHAGRRRWQSRQAKRRGTLVATEEDEIDEIGETGEIDHAMEGALEHALDLEQAEGGAAGEAGAALVGRGACVGAEAAAREAANKEELSHTRGEARGRRLQRRTASECRPDSAAADDVAAADKPAAKAGVGVRGEGIGDGTAAKGSTKSKARAAVKTAKKGLHGPPSKALHAPQKACGAAFAVGARVRVHGLVSCAQHNGLEGSVAARAETSSGLRLNVACTGGERLRLKPGNLQLLET